jgi:hypothetical protein
MTNETTATVSSDTLLADTIANLAAIDLDNIEKAAADFAAAADSNVDALEHIAALLMSFVPLDNEDFKKSREYIAARERANAGLRVTFLSRQRYTDGTPLDMELCRNATSADITDKDVKGWAKDDPRRIARKATQGFMRTKWQRIAALAFPKALSETPTDSTDAEPTEAAAPTTIDPTDPTAALAGITTVLVGLSRSNPAAAKALLNGLDNLVKYARPYIAEGKAIEA